ncbi:MAG: pyridoxal 5'-phosphate synthase glutaminase subunit PdxT [candidate division Zixibacteria bacterium]
MNKKIIGVLAIQGDFQAHKVILSKIGVESREIRLAGDLDGITHLIIPGGESTTIQKVAKQNGLWSKLAAFDGPVMGTCMGSILMGKQTEANETLGMIEMKIQRNAYGRQINSFTAEGKIKFIDDPFEMVFIRAPKIVEIGENVEPIAWLNDEITGVVSGNRMAVTFHPELSDSVDVHRYFVQMRLL